jgi:putative Mn2+ efflux pump MntP
VLAVGLGLDNLVVGFSLGIPGAARPLTLAATIAAFAMVFTLAGMRLGCEGHRRWEAVAQRGAGAALGLLAPGVASGALA